MMKLTEFTLPHARIELVSEDDCVKGVGRIWIKNVLVRSGRLPMRIRTQSFRGDNLSHLRLDRVEETGGEISIIMQAAFTAASTHPMRDHSLDPIHDLTDWDAERPTGQGTLILRIKESFQEYGGRSFIGFSYQYQYQSDDIPLYYLLDDASWELDGDIAGATAISQSSCSAPVATFSPETTWSTEGKIFFGSAGERVNDVMTHNLPRWASHQAFDFQYRSHKTLLGVYERVGLIRTVLMREAGKPELKTFDKHLFDEAFSFATPAKHILLNTDPKTEIDQQNLWTWVIDEVHESARAEFGLEEEPFEPRLAVNYWRDFTADTYRDDLLPAAKAIGVKAVFIDNLHKSAATERCPHPAFHWNMCCGHEYEIAPSLGGVESVRRFMDTCAEEGIQVYSWTNNAQALSSPVNEQERDARHWFVHMEDSRMKYGGAYTNVLSILDFKNPDARSYWVESLKQTKELTGLSGYLFDSFYNLGFMPVNYNRCKPTVMWKELLEAFADLQRSGINFLIESFGPFGQVQHGCPSTYNFDTLFACYKVGLGNDYTTIPEGKVTRTWHDENPKALFKALAHQSAVEMPLFRAGSRIDQVWGEEQKSILKAYYEAQPHMHRRTLREDGAAVEWESKDRKTQVVWNFIDRTIPESDSAVWDIACKSQAEAVNGEIPLRSGRVYLIPRV